MSESVPTRSAAGWQKALPWLITIVCFGFLWTRIQGAATQCADLDVATYMARVLASVRWGPWLAMMVPYSLLFLCIDTLVIWRVITWFNAPVRLRDVSTHKTNPDTAASVGLGKK